MVRDNLETFLPGRRADARAGCPRFLEESFRRYLRCGVVRLSIAEDGQVVYRLPLPWPNSAGVTHLVLEGTELLARLAALVPAEWGD